MGVSSNVLLGNFVDVSVQVLDQDQTAATELEALDFTAGNDLVNHRPSYADHAGGFIDAEGKGRGLLVLVHAKSPFS